MKKPTKKLRIVRDDDPVPDYSKVTSIHPKRKISDTVVARSRVKPVRENPFTIPSFPSIALPPGSKRKGGRIAMDEQIIEVNAWAVQNLYGGAFTNGATFLGYPYLAELSQIPEYRKITETIAMHMTRKFITLQSVAGEEGGEDKTQKIKEITDALEDFKVRDLFRKAAEVDGYFGRAHLYVDLGYQTLTELKMPIGNGRDALSQLKITKGSLKGFKIIEPVWTYPGNYNSNDPFNISWYSPQTWFVLGKEIHHSRLMRMVGREVADLLKPAYAFGGLSMSQLAKPYVDNWLRTRQSVADVIWSFSTSGVMTDLQTLMQGQGDDLFARAELYNNLRNNRGLMMLNKDSEEFFQINTPLGTLDKLQAQAQEHMASVSSIPLIFLLGITPSGLNASSEGEIRAFYDFIHSFQTKFFTEPLTRVIDFIQLHLYGVIDPEITFIYEPLWSMDEKALAEIDKTKAETDDLRINGGVISPLESRKAVANAPDTPYAGLDVTVIPVPPGGDGNEEEPDDPNDPDLPEPIGGRGLDPGKASEDSTHHQRIGGESDNDDSPFAHDAGFEESKHPRGQPGNAGQFGSGGSSGGEKKNFKEIKTGQEYLDIAKASERQLSDEDKATINHYTSPAYAALNKALRSGKPLPPETQKVVDNLDRIISESRLPEDVTLFRGLRGKKVREVLDALVPGETLTDPAFVSTGMHKMVAQNQQGAGTKATMVIRAPKGANAVFPGENSYNYNQESKIDTALEAILPRESQFKFIGKKGATYEFELVPPNKGAQDEAKFEESKHPRAPNGQFGSGGGATSHESVKALNKVLTKPAGISGKYRQQLQTMLKDPGLNDEMKLKIKHKIIESYEAKAKQLHKAGDTAKAASVAQKAIKLGKSIGIKPKEDNPISKIVAPKHTVEESHGHPGKFVVKNSNGDVLGNNGEFGKGIVTKKFDTKAQAEAFAAGHDKNSEKKVPQTPTAAEVKSSPAPDKTIANKLGVDDWASLSDEDKSSLTDLAGIGEGAYHYKTAKQTLANNPKLAEGGLTPAKAAHILAYSGSAYADTNGQLRSNSISEETHNHSVQLNDALSKLPKYTKPTTRGTKLSTTELAKWQPGKIVADHGFMSTTKKSEPDFSGNVMFTVHGKNGRDIQQLSHHDHEREVLFPSGTKFKIVSRTESYGKHHITIEEV